MILACASWILWLASQGWVGPAWPPGAPMHGSYVNRGLEMLGTAVSETVCLRDAKDRAESAAVRPNEGDVVVKTRHGYQATLRAVNRDHKVVREESYECWPSDVDLRKLRGR